MGVGIIGVVAGTTTCIRSAGIGVVGRCVVGSIVAAVVGLHAATPSLRIRQSIYDNIDQVN